MKRTIAGHTFVKMGKFPEIRYKQYVILNKSLGMTLGKSCAMTAHASVLAIRKQEIDSDKVLISEWLKNGECVIVLQAHTSTQMFGIQQYCKRKEIKTSLYIDEGLTEVPMGEPTCLATGVVSEKDFWMFDQLELYSDKDSRDDLIKDMTEKVDNIIDEKVYLNEFNIGEPSKTMSNVSKAYIGTGPSLKVTYTPSGIDEIRIPKHL